jgi:hypothetical protein
MTVEKQPPETYLQKNPQFSLASRPAQARTGMVAEEGTPYALSTKKFKSNILLKVSTHSLKGGEKCVCVKRK